MRIKNISCFILCFLFLSGCVNTEIVDDVSFKLASGYDYVNEKEMRGTFLVPEFLPDKTIKNVTYSAVSSGPFEITKEIQRQVSDPIVRGSLEGILFGNELAKKGIKDLLDSFERDASIGGTLHLGITEGDAKDVLEGEFGTRGNAVYLDRMFKHNMDHQDLPESNLKIFLSDYYQKGKDGYLPLLKKINKKRVKINGLCLFKEDKVVDELSVDKLFFFKLMTDQYAEGTYKVEINGKKASIESISSKYKMKFAGRNPYKIKLNIKLKGEITDYTGKNLTMKIKDNIEKTMEKDINEQCSKLISRFQEKSIDPLGFGAFVKSRTRNFDFAKWEDEYQNLTVDVNSEINLIEEGVIE
ncbi:Ger(x)C family spore germination protein [Bacillus methanolicus]|uniref:Ger(x)C family spore germination protein n=1 Tax=Bacillus methanolicus TaxID=1471 RepID=UPI002380ABB4|nr:Ger(x)C family spore germination protein [Bacillus methanolicus]MDE3840054.1 Ger(x)C family spore germination protein [Bacillus methanolicus]